MSTMSVSRRAVAFSLWVCWKYVLFILSKAPSFWHESLAFQPSPGTLGELVALFQMAGETFSDLKDKWLCAAVISCCKHCSKSDWLMITLWWVPNGHRSGCYVFGSEQRPCVLTAWVGSEIDAPFWSVPGKICFSWKKRCKVALLLYVVQT